MTTQSLLLNPPRKPFGLLAYNPSTYGHDHNVVVSHGARPGKTDDELPSGQLRRSVPVSRALWHRNDMTTGGLSVIPVALPVKRAQPDRHKPLPVVSHSISTRLMGGVMSCREAALARYDNSLDGQILAMAGGRGYGLTRSRQSADQPIQSSIPTGGCVAAAARLATARFGGHAHGRNQVNDSTLLDAAGAAAAAIYQAIERQYISSVAAAPMIPRTRAINGMFDGGLPRDLFTVGRLAARNSISADGRSGSIREHRAGEAGYESVIVRLDAPADDSGDVRHGAIHRSKPATLYDQLASVPDAACPVDIDAPIAPARLDGDKSEYLSCFAAGASYEVFSASQWEEFELWVCRVAQVPAQILKINGLPPKSDTARPGARRARLIVRLIRNVSASHPEATDDAVRYAGYPSQNSARMDLGAAKFWDAMREALPAIAPVPATRDATQASGVGYRPLPSRLTRDRARDWESAKSMLHSRL